MKARRRLRRSPPAAPPGKKWVLAEETDEDVLDEQDKTALERASFHRDPSNPFAAVDNYINDSPRQWKRLPPEGAWIMVKRSPVTEYTVPPLSMWYAEEWPGMEIYRIKIVTPRGSLGLLSSEYEIVRDLSAYLPFIGGEIAIRFFGNTPALPADSLFYLRSRGIGKMEAITMLLGDLKCPGFCWLEVREDIARAFTSSWPDASRLATAL